MSVRAFACSAPGAARVLGYVAVTSTGDWPAGTAIVRLRIGSEWHCARLDRSRVVEVEGMLVRDAVPSDETDCPECATQPSAAASIAEPAAQPPAPAAAVPASKLPPVQAAAISLQGRRMVVVLVRRGVIDDAGEAALLQGALQTRFGGAAVVLMGQDDDGTPHYHGDPALTGLLHGLPVERMPWRTHPAPVGDGSPSN